MDAANSRTPLTNCSVKFISVNLKNSLTIEKIESLVRHKITKFYIHYGCFILCDLLGNPPLEIACSKLTMVTIEEGVKYVQS